MPTTCICSIPATRGNDHDFEALRWRGPRSRVRWAGSNGRRIPRGLLLHQPRPRNSARWRSPASPRQASRPCSMPKATSRTSNFAGRAAIFSTGPRTMTGSTRCAAGAPPISARSPCRSFLKADTSSVQKPMWQLMVRAGNARRQTPGEIWMTNPVAGTAQKVFAANLAGLGPARLSAAPRWCDTRPATGWSCAGQALLRPQGAGRGADAPPVLFNVHGGPFRVEAWPPFFCRNAISRCARGCRVPCPMRAAAPGSGRTYFDAG